MVGRLVLVLWRLAVLWLLMMAVYWLALIAWSVIPEDETPDPPTLVTS